MFDQIDDYSVVKLFCIAYAGGSAINTYGKWATHLGGQFDPIPLEYSGHGNRMTEPLYNNVQEAIEDLLPNVLPHLKNGETYAFYGHSMGCLVVYEMLRKLSSLGIHDPSRVFLSGRVTPGVAPKRTISDLDDATFVQQTKQIGGTQDKLFDISDVICTVFANIEK